MARPSNTREGYISAMPAWVNCFLARRGPPEGPAAAAVRTCRQHDPSAAVAKMCRQRLPRAGGAASTPAFVSPAAGRESGSGAGGEVAGRGGEGDGVGRRACASGLGPAAGAGTPRPQPARKRAWLSAMLRVALLKIRALRGRGRRGPKASPPGMRLTAQGACTIRVGKSGKLCNLVGNLWKSCSKKALQEAWTPRGGSCCLRSTARGLR